MRLIRGNLFDPKTYSRGGRRIRIRPDAICITTNGYIRRNGSAVMGKGCAKEARERWQGLQRVLGHRLRQYGNIIHFLTKTEKQDGSISIRLKWPYRGEDELPFHILSFPVKPIGELCKKDKSNVIKSMRSRFRFEQYVPGWACMADPVIIEHSAEVLVELADWRGWKHVVLPRPGCGNGGLEWKLVKPILADLLDNRFKIIAFPKEDAK